MSKWLQSSVVFLSMLAAGLALLMAVQTRMTLARLGEAREYDGLDTRVANGVYEFFATPRHREVLRHDLCGGDTMGCTKTKEQSSK
jgi:hypothetical protein